MADERIEQASRRWRQLKGERSSWMPQWQEIQQYVMPYAGRFSMHNPNDGTKRDQSIYDNTATQALGNLGAGLMSGLTSPARPWFKLGVADPELNKHHAVREWLDRTTELMEVIFAKSNTYRALHGMYEELGAFGIGCSVCMQDFENVIHQYPMTIGEYAVASSARGEVDTLYREYQMTVAQMVKQFGYENVSQATRKLFDQHNLSAWVTVLHLMEPRIERDPRKKDGQNKPYKSIYLEPAQEKVLSESGFDMFRGLCPRWIVNGRDMYGHSPGMEALGDVKQLQFDQLRKAKAIDFQTDPPLQAPTAYKHADLDTLPGGISYVDSPSQGGGIRSAFEVNLDLNALVTDILDIRNRIHGSFYTDLFRMLSSYTGPQMTATEVIERQEEKMLMLGPVLERLHNELLDPLVETTFATMVNVGIVPPPPQELQGQELSVEYVSILAQSQKAVETHSIDRFVSSLGVVAQMKPGVLDKFNADEWADVYADKLGVDPDIITPDRKVALIRQQRAQMDDSEEKVNNIQELASAAKDLSQADTTGDNALARILREAGG